MTDGLYSYTVPGGGHWSFRVKRGLSLTLKDVEGGANAGVLFYNPDNYLERYNAPDTLKCQHTFKLTKGHCLYSDMGRIFCSIVEDSLGWHETVCGNSTAKLVAERWGARDYQHDRNDWHQNGFDSFLVELAKYGLGVKDLAANLNLFSKVAVDDQGNVVWEENHSPAGSSITLRFEMDTLVLLHTCPHPLNTSPRYPSKPVVLTLDRAGAMSEGDVCLNHCEENRRGFENNRLYYLGGGQ